MCHTLRRQQMLASRRGAFGMTARFLTDSQNQFCRVFRGRYVLCVSYRPIFEAYCAKNVTKKCEFVNETLITLKL